MIEYWNRISVLERTILILLVGCTIALLASLIWDFATWPISLLVLVLVVVNGMRMMRHSPGAPPQENDPNRR